MLLAGPLTAVAGPAVARPAVADDRRTPTVIMHHPRVTPQGPTDLVLALARRTIYSEVVVRDDRLVFRGDVERYFNRRVYIQRKGCVGCDWRRYDVVTTNDRGWFRSEIGAPKRGSAYWRAKVPASDGYARSYSAVWQTHY